MEKRMQHNMKTAVIFWLVGIIGAIIIKIKLTYQGAAKSLHRVAVVAWHSP